MPNVRDLAAADARAIIEAENGAGSPIILINKKMEYPVMGTYSDIGSLVNPITGEAVQSRAIEAAIPMETIMALAGEAPTRKWKARITEADGKPATLFVNRVEADRTVGLFRLTLGLQLSEKADG